MNSGELIFIKVLTFIKVWELYNFQFAKYRKVDKKEYMPLGHNIIIKKLTSHGGYSNFALPHYILSLIIFLYLLTPKTLLLLIE